jgi:ribosomal protein S21
MPIIVEKKNTETPVSLVDRFSKEVRRSGMLQRAKRQRFWQRPLSDLARKRSALKRLESRKHYQLLRKMGKI